MSSSNEINIVSESREEDWDIILTPQNKWYNIDLKGVWRYRDLLMLFVRRDFVAQFKQTLLGPLWIILQPVITTLIFAFIFSKLANLPTADISPILYYMAGFVPWTFFADCLNRTSTTFTANAAIFGKVYFPRLVIPISLIIANGFKFIIQLALFFLIALLIHFANGKTIHPDSHLIYLPFLMLLMAGWGLATGLLISSLTVRYKDITFLVGYFLQLLMYSSSVIFSLLKFGPKIASVMKWNPLLQIIEAFRYALTGTGVFSWNGLLYSTGVMLVLLAIAIIRFAKVEKSFMDTI